MEPGQLRRQGRDVHAIKPMREVTLLDSSASPFEGQVSNPTRSQ